VTVTDGILPRPLTAHLKLLTCFVLMGLLSVAVVAEQAQPHFPCDRHSGAFSNEVSSDFDIDRLDCHVSSVRNSPTIQFWSVPPYVGITW
jgi:hypothetical protein